jgi:3'(2'), 5'-bisphosphate nucleotidase
VAQNEHRDLAEGLLAAVLSAGRIELAHFNAGVRVERKADQTPVTIADRLAEQVLLEALQRLRPKVPVIAEEAVAAGPIPEISGRFFLVDPLDGTRGFIEGRSEFTINVALVDNGAPLFGLIYAPALAQLFLTLGPHEAVKARLDPKTPFCGLAALGLVAMRTRIADPAALKALTSHAHLNARTLRFLEGYRVVERLALASSLKFALLADGCADLYPRLGPTSEWDTAAGHAIVRAAGGSVTRLDGAELSYGHREQGFRNPYFVAWGRRPLAASEA